MQNKGNTWWNIGFNVSDCALLNHADERHKYLVGSNDKLSLPINIDNLSIVLCSPIRH